MTVDQAPETSEKPARRRECQTGKKCEQFDAGFSE